MSLVLSVKNTAVIACAGSGKTTFIVREALKVKDSNVLITTYTLENVDQINQSILEQNGFIPSNITVVSWFAFLLRDGVRPYQNHLSKLPRARSVFFQTKNIPFHKKDNYLTASFDVYSNKASEFAVECNTKSGGKVISRLEKIYSHIFLDELQDFAGYDLDLIEALFYSAVTVTAVGDPRQSTFSTNSSAKNKHLKGKNVDVWLQQQEKAGVVTIENRMNCRRCNQQICDFSDLLFPNYPTTISENNEVTGHDGIFVLPKSQVEQYVVRFNPVILRWNRSSDTMSYPALNFGISKGRTYNRVLIFPTKPMVKFLQTKTPEATSDLSKFYVAVTRARYSVAFVVEDSKISSFVFDVYNSNQYDK
jgi:DNA helicase II / ATP-dependent DNA helicase PcrA